MEKLQEKNRLTFHLMPPKGWMNDPNGSCYYKNNYHIFFQYSPEEVRGGQKSWGHYRSRDLVNWEFVGEAILPDIPEDKDGVYSGCAFVEDGKLEVFYTGNVKEEGEYDYTYAGRGANVIYVSSEDGLHFSQKQVLLTNKDYPGEYSCHIRDPKVWKEGDTYYMVLGGRKGSAPEAGTVKADTEDHGGALIYTSKDKLNWHFLRELTTKEYFGFMWECPDYFELDGKTVFAFCPQGLQKETYRFQNSDQSGYLICEKERVQSDGKSEETEAWKLSDFKEWDMGFDFYAPQTFLTPDGRRLLIGWVGLPGADYTNEATVKEGWQHCLTVLRELTFENGTIRQWPVRELEALRGKLLLSKQEAKLEAAKENQEIVTVQASSFDCSIYFEENASKKEIYIENDLSIQYKDGIIKVIYTNDTGEGRKIRQAKLQGVGEIRILKDRSMVEIYVNHGEAVFSTRYYPKDMSQCRLTVTGSVKEMNIWEMGTIYE